MNLTPCRKNVCCFLMLALALPLFCQAQLCSGGGSLGDPFVNFDFGSAGFYQLPKGITDYKIGGDCPGAGQYLLVNLCYGCDSNNLHLIAGDHTDQIKYASDGNCMFVNAQDTFYNPRYIFSDTLNALCSGITYQFAAYMANVMKTTDCGGFPVHPNITLKVTDTKGNVITSYTTGDIPETSATVWNQYGCFFTMPANLQAVVVQITTNNTGHCGNYFLLDDITVQACGSKVTASLDRSTQQFFDVCTGYTNPFVLTATYLGLNNPTMVWQTSTNMGNTWQDVVGATTTTYQVPRVDSGNILYRLEIANPSDFSSPDCRIVSNVISITVHYLPLHLPPTPGIGCLGKDFTFPFLEEVTNYSWVGPNGFQSAEQRPVIPNIQPADTGIYTVTLITDFNCTATDTVDVGVYPAVTLSTPSSYTVCQGQDVQLQASGGDTYLWTPATGLSSDTIPNPVIAHVNDTAKYEILTANTYGCRDSTFIAVNVYHNATANAGPNENIIFGDTATLNGTAGGTAVDYYWTPANFISNPQSLTPQVYPPGEQEYVLHVTSTVGCGTAESIVKISVYKNLFIPTAFTPNGDGINDVFRITPLDEYTLVRFSVYNRWGKAVFNTANAGAGWDGNYNQTPQPPGAYIYYAEFKLPNGQQVVKKGTVVLIR